MMKVAGSQVALGFEAVGDFVKVAAVEAGFARAVAVAELRVAEEEAGFVVIVAVVVAEPVVIEVDFAMAVEVKAVVDFGFAEIEIAVMMSVEAENDFEVVAVAEYWTGVDFDSLIAAVLEFGDFVVVAVAEYWTGADFDSLIVVDFANLIEAGFDNSMIVFVIDLYFVHNFDTENCSDFEEFVKVPEPDTLEFVAESRTDFVGCFENYMAVVAFVKIYR
jgi:hypothetical protein